MELPNDVTDLSEAPRPPSRGVRVVFALLVAGIACLSFAYALLVPVGEGFDELAHYSYISQLATTGTIPNQLEDTMDLGWQLRHKGYPAPYSSTEPFEKVAGLNYRQFFSMSESARARSLAWWLSSGGGSGYVPGEELNAAGQHPPLYYATMAPFFLMSRGWAYQDRALLLRIASVLIALASFIFLWLAIRDAPGEGRRRWLLAGAVLAVTPAFYFDIARIGNDSLCLLLGSATVWLLLRLHDRGPGPSVVIPLGLVLGLGAVTKLFFLPLTLGILVCVLIFGYRRYGWKRVLVTCAVILLLVLVLSGWWYVRNQVLYGNLTGAQDFIVQKNVPSLAISAGTFAKEFGLSIAHFWQTLVYSSTWSFMAIPKWGYLPFALTWLIAIAGIIILLFRGSPRQKRLLLGTIIITVFLSSGFASHASLFIFKTGHGGVTNGYYLYFVWMMIFGALALGLLKRRRQKNWYVGFIGLALAAMWLVSRIADWTLLMTYSGLGAKGAHGALTGAGAPFTRVGTGLTRLGELMPVTPGAVLWVAAMVLQIVAIILLVRHLASRRRIPA